MRRAHVLVALDSDGRTPPTEVHLFDFGLCSTLKGDFLLTPESAQQVMMAYHEHGVDLALDFDHGMLGDGDIASKKAAGWAKLTLRTDGLWLTSIKWTPEAAEYIENAEFRYLSPAFSAHEDTHEILELINVAITNLPATHNQKPLVAANRRSTRRLHMNKRTLSKHLSEHAEKMGGPEHLAKFLGMTGQQLNSLLSGTAASQEELSVCKSKLSIKDEELSLDGMDVNKSKASPGEGGPFGLGGEATVEHDPDEASEDQSQKMNRRRPASTQSLRRVVGELVKLTGADSEQDLVETLAGWKEKAEAYEDDHAILLELKRSQDDSQRRELIALGKLEKKLTPALIAHFAKRPVSALREFLSVAPTLTFGGEHMEPETQVTTLSREEKEVVALTGGDEKAFLAMRAMLGRGLVRGRTEDSPEWGKMMMNAMRNPPTPPAHFYPRIPGK